MAVRLRLILTARVLAEILRYEVVVALRGFRGVHYGLNRPLPPRKCQEGIESAVREAVETVTTLYWRRVLCLERSVITARVLHRYGVAAEVVIGYRLKPFAGHAWVEIDGQVVNDSPGCAEKLHVLERFRPALAAVYESH